MAATHSTGALDRPVPYSLTLAADALPRRVTVDVRGQAVTVDCPPWCVASHAETLVALSDLCHEGEPAALAAPTYSAGAPRTTQVLTARVMQYPFSVGPDARPMLALDAADDGETAELPASAALAFADQLVAHAERIRRQARHLVPADEPLIGPAARHMGVRLRAEGVQS